MSFKAVVKCVLSGDTVILRGNPRPNGPPAERLLALSNVQAPRLGNMDKAEENFAFESREFLRKKLAGKQISFTIDYVVSTSNPPREYGTIKLSNGDNVAELGLKDGWLKVREQKLRGSDEAAAETLERLQLFEDEARHGQRGMWNPEEKGKREVSFVLDSDPSRFLNQYKGKELDAIVEQVRDASTFRVLVFLPDKSQQYVTLFLSGIKAPACKRDQSDENSPASEPFGEQAKLFVETLLLQQNVKVIFEGISQSGGNFFMGSVRHPNGNISDYLLSKGFAKCVDWSITMVTGGPVTLRNAEKTAKAKKLGVWHNYVEKEMSTKFTGHITKIVSGDTLLVKSSSGAEKKVQLASVKQAPRGAGNTAPGANSKSKDVHETGYQFEAREFLRKKLIGKQVQVVIDYHKPAQDGFEAKDCATVTVDKTNIAEALVKRGLASVIRHRKDDDNRSSCYDALLIAEEKAKSDKKGIHSTEPLPVVRIVDASENATKARQFITFLKRSKQQAIVDHVANGSRLILWVPKENCRLVFVLEGIRAPRAGRSPNDHSEPYGKESLDYVTQHCLHHDVEIEVSDVDKTGAFIGTLFVGKDNLAVSLLEQGLATVHEYSANNSSHVNQLFSAERRAKDEKSGLWENYDPDAEAEAKAAVSEKVAEVSSTPRKDYIDVVVSDILSGSHFYVQKVVSSEIQQLESLMKDLKIHNNSRPGDASMKARVGDIVSAKFTEDDMWYRARVRKVSAAGVDVLYIDFGNSEVLPTSRIRELPEKFKRLEAQAHEAMLSLVKCPAKSEDYGEEALDELKNLVEGRSLVANVDAKEGSVLRLTLYDPSRSTDQDKSLNWEMVRSGFAFVTPKVRHAHDPKTLEVLHTALEEAKRDRAGMFEHGDITPVDD